MDPYILGSQQIIDVQYKILNPEVLNRKRRPVRKAVVKTEYMRRKRIVEASKGENGNQEYQNGHHSVTEFSPAGFLFVIDLEKIKSQPLIEPRWTKKNTKSRWQKSSQKIDEERYEAKEDEEFSGDHEIDGADTDGSEYKVNIKTRSSHTKKK